MKFLLILPILHFAWTTQAYVYTGHELVHLPRDDIPTHLLVRYVDGGLDDVEQTLLARGLPYEPELMARELLQPLLVKRARGSSPPSRERTASPSRSPPPAREGAAPLANSRYLDRPRHPSAGQAQTLNPRVRNNLATAAVGGMLTAGTMIGIGSSTDWYDHKQAIGGAIGMGCVGAAAFTAACAFHLNKQNMVPGNPRRGSPSQEMARLVPSRAPTPMQSRVNSEPSPGPQNVLSAQDRNTPHSPTSSSPTHPDPNHPENLVRRSLV